MVGIPEEKNEIHRRVKMIACQYFTFIKCLVAFISHVPYWLHSCALVFLNIALSISSSPYLLTTRLINPLSPLIPGALFILFFAAHPHLSCLRAVCTCFVCPIRCYVSTVQGMSSTFSFTLHYPLLLANTEEIFIK